MKAEIRLYTDESDSLNKKLIEREIRALTELTGDSGRGKTDEKGRFISFEIDLYEFIEMLNNKIMSKIELLKLIE